MSSRRVVLVTGGSRGIGAATCRVAAEAGFDVAVNYASNGAAAISVVEAVEKAGGSACAIQADIGDAAAIKAMFEEVERRFGRLDGLVNNAGVVDVKSRVDEMNPDRLERMMRINVSGTILCAGHAVRRMSTRHGGRGGSIVNLSSVAAAIGGPGEYVDYAASKGAVESFTRGLAREVAGESIRVNAVRPGVIDTEIHASGGQPERVAAIRGLVPMKREGTAEEVARAILWLLSDEASYSTGTIIDVSGGR